VPRIEGANCTVATRRGRRFGDEELPSVAGDREAVGPRREGALPQNAVRAEVVGDQATVPGRAAVAPDARVERRRSRVDGDASKRVQLWDGDAFDQPERWVGVEHVDLPIREHVFEAMKPRSTGRAVSANNDPCLLVDGNRLREERRLRRSARSAASEPGGDEDGDDARRPHPGQDAGLLAVAVAGVRSTGRHSSRTLRSADTMASTAGARSKEGEQRELDEV